MPFYISTHTYRYLAKTSSFFPLPKRPKKHHFSNFKIPSYIFKAKQPTIAQENDAISAMEPKNFSIKSEGGD